MLFALISTVACTLPSLTNILYFVSLIFSASIPFTLTYSISLFPDFIVINNMYSYSFPSADVTFIGTIMPVPAVTAPIFFVASFCCCCCGRGWEASESRYGECVSVSVVVAVVVAIVIILRILKKKK